MSDQTVKRDWVAEATRAELVIATVRSIEPEQSGGMRFCIDPDGTCAQRATGCLVEPRPHDVVLVAARPDGDPLIISVLTRAPHEAAALSVPSASGISMTAPEIALTAETNLTAAARSVEVHASEGHFAITATRFLGDTAFLVLGTVEALYSRLQSYAEKLIVKAGYSLRLVDELDSTVAPNVMVQAKQTYSLQAMQTILTSTHDTRIDGERISMG